jgi:hypothetical protein
VRGGLRKSAGSLPAGSAGEAQSERHGPGGLSAAAQQQTEPHHQVQQGGADVGAVQGVAVEGMANGGRSGQSAGNDGAGIDTRARSANFRPAFPPSRRWTVAG